MTVNSSISCAVAACCALTLALAAGSAEAASAVQKECSAKYQTAKSGGTLNGMTYNQYYKQCAAEAKAEKAGGAAPAAPAAAVAPAPAAPTANAPTTTAPVSKPTAAAPAAKSAPAPVASGNAVFPTAVSAQFSKESAGKARMHTCLAQYNANKAGGGNGGLKWIMKGGGYYSECNTRLKS